MPNRNVNPVVRTALRNLQRREREDEAKLASLQAAVDAGETSGIAAGNVFSRVRRILRLPATGTGRG